MRRSWKIFGAKAADNNVSTPTAASDPTASTGESTRSLDNNSTDGFLGFMSGSGALGSPPPHGNTSRQDARLERQVALAARKLGEGVQSIVQVAKEAKGESKGEWRTQLLTLMDGPDVELLLKNTSMPHFVMRCVENELPPNLIHCLRLLRVLELQNAAQDPNAESIGRQATAKVSRLLVALCKDASVGEQVRPHLFGLLALSGASYPPAGIPVPRAASEVIIALAENCMSRSLVYFIHDKKMVMHMTDDIKELIGMVEATATPNIPNGLIGAEAEKVGLWAIALRTVVKLVYASCKHNSISLVRDFEAANGYEVIQYAIEHATAPFGKELIEILPFVACFPSEPVEEDDEETLKIATNLRIFEMQEDLLLRSNPLLREYRLNNNDERPDLHQPGTLAILADFSIQVAARSRNADPSKSNTTEGLAFDVSSELLSMALQLYSNHGDNYDTIEDRQHLLTYYLLSFPCYNDEDLKMLVMKTLEFVLTGVGVADEVTPVNACVEIYFALCQTLLIGEEAIEVDNAAQVIQLLESDADLMGRTLEKLLQFDQRVAPLMVESGVLTTSLDSLLDLISNYREKHGTGAVPPASTPLDKTFDNVCRVLKLLVAHQPVNFSKESCAEDEEPTNMHTLLRLAVKDLGLIASRAAAGVFEAYMSSFASTVILYRDMTYVLDLIEFLGKLSSSTEMDVDAELLERQCIILSMLKSVLEARSLARDAFRECGGFDVLLRILLGRRGRMSSIDNGSEKLRSALVASVQGIISLLEAAIGMKSRNPLTSNESTPLALTPDAVVDPISSQLSSRAPASLNRMYIRKRGYYLDLAAAIAGTGVLETEGKSIMDLACAHVDTSLSLESKDILSIRNPDAIRLVIAISIFLKDGDQPTPLSHRILDTVIHLCQPEKIATTLQQIASCGLVYSISNPDEFGKLLLENESPIQTRLFEVMHLSAASNMSYNDFVSVLRCLAGPLLSAESSDGRVRLQVISSSIAKKSNTPSSPTNQSIEQAEQRTSKLIERLEHLRNIARDGDRIPRTRVGGDSINTLAVLMHQIKLEERLKAAAEQGRLKYLEVDSLSALPDPSGAGTSTAAASSDLIWAPLTGSGFSFSLWLRYSSSETGGNLHVFDMFCPTTIAKSPTYLSVWYDIQAKCFNVMSSASYRSEPTCFPVSPLRPGVWHHILLTFNPSKRTMMSRKSAFSIFVDGRPLEADIRVDSVNLPPSSRLVIGAPNPALATVGVLRGMLPVWELGPTLMFSAVLLDLDATAIYSYGPDFPGMLWGDRPQRLSLASTAAATFPMLADNGEYGSIASALRRREVADLEMAGYCAMAYTEKDELSSMNLLCTLPPESLVFAYQASSCKNRIRSESLPGERRFLSERLVNLARLSYGSDAVATDAIVHGKATVVVPNSFADCLQWTGGPPLLMPLLSAASQPRIISLVLEIIRHGTKLHRPNLESMQAGGGYRIMAVLLQEKDLDTNCLEECLAFSIHGFERLSIDNQASSSMTKRTDLVLSDADAMKYLLLNHQVWSLRKYGPNTCQRLLEVLNELVDHSAVHKSFNARRLHRIGVVRWALHLMIEAAELFSSDKAKSVPQKFLGSWACELPSVKEVSVGADPGNPFLMECKNLLRRVLTFMLTPPDLEAIAEAIVYTGSLSSNEKQKISDKDIAVNDEHMMPAASMRLHLVRLLEELIVDGVNEIIASVPTPKQDPLAPKESRQPHAGGVASPNQPYLSTIIRLGKASDAVQHPKHQQAQAFLSAFAGFLTPVWFATVLESCREEASASALLRLMILMLQSSITFEGSFHSSGGFAPFVLSIPRFSTCPGITLAMLSQLLSVPILHLHSLPSLDPDQLCEVFDAECEDCDPVIYYPPDPSSGIFALLAECIGRNIQLISSGGELGAAASNTNQAIFQLLSHRHNLSPSFQEYCCSPSFFEPLAQALCLVYNEKLQGLIVGRPKRRSLLADVPAELTPTERFVGGPSESDSGGMGIVRLLRTVIFGMVLSSPRAAQILRAIFFSFPIHASPQQVEAFHLVLIEHCRFVVDSALQQGDAIALANCIGLCSVLLDQQLQGFLTSEAILESIRMIFSVLETLIRSESASVLSLNNAEHTMLTWDAAYMARLMCVTGLKLSLPSHSLDVGDEDLQSEILQLLDSKMDSILLIPSRDRKSKRKIPTAPYTRLATSSKMYPLWQAASIGRSPSSRHVTYPELSESESPDTAVIAPLLGCLHRFLVGSRDDVRSLAISVLVALLHNRPNVMSDLLVTEVSNGDHLETIDVVNRGGFRALLVAHEAATLGDTGSKSVSVKRRYAAFFDWFEKNQNQVQLVFNSVNERASRLFPGLERPNLSQAEAVENEQKQMLKRLTVRTSDRTILGGLERSELARHCSERTAESHNRWKHEGFSDLAYGAMMWKILLRQLKGTFSIWEGGYMIDKGQFSLEDRIAKIEADGPKDREHAKDVIRRWKLDLSEGFERQRRRLLPNYEFHGLYNIDEEADMDASLNSKGEELELEKINAPDFLGSGDMEATAALLKDLNLKRTHRTEEDDFDEFFDAEEIETVATTATGVSSGDGASAVTDEDENMSDHEEVPASGKRHETEPQEAHDEPVVDSEHSSSYELVTGLLQAGDWPEKSYNVNRCTGLEVTKALFLWCKDAIYIIDGFEQTGDGIDGKITRVEREQSSFYVNLRPKDFNADSYDADPTAKVYEEKSNSGKYSREASRVRSAQHDTNNAVIYQHRCKRIPFSELYAVYRRRYQLQQNALEFYDVNKSATLIAFKDNKNREEVLTKVLQSPLPNSIFSSTYGTFVTYSKFISNLKARVVSQWMSGKMTNFDFLMHLNSFAGRSFNDLTQYPVFPWVIADYESEELDLNDPNTFRDLSKPMGAIGEERAKQFRERYEALASTYFGDDDPPPFHYGTHYSSAAYVLYYLMRLEPFSRLALALQGGRFDVADRLFHDIGRSWKSASSENLQDVRELIPEFFYLPDFLVNSNNFDFGETQRGKTVHDVTLPPWAKGDPKRFIQINRQALESDHVSKNLHKWVDLIFGYKQRGQDAVDALNTFVHVTYEGEVDLEAMSDPVQRASTIAQIQNFGQTPSRLERKPFPQRLVVAPLKEKSIDFGSLATLTPLTPPFCVVGAPHRVQVAVFISDSCKLGSNGVSDKAVGDLCLWKGQIVAVGRLCGLIEPSRKYFRYGGVNNGLTIHSATISTRYRENKLLSAHDALHGAPISVAKASADGRWLVTGCVDSTLRIWRYSGSSLELQAQLCGHDGHQIRCIDVSVEFGVVASGCTQGRVILWDIRTLTFVRRLGGFSPNCPVSSVSINNCNGNVVALVGTSLCVFDINGHRLAQLEFQTPNLPTTALATDCPEWMTRGIAVVTGHLSGEVRFWSINYESSELVLRHTLENNPHHAAITALRATGSERQDTLLIGDGAGKVSACKTVTLDSYKNEELASVVSELLNGTARK